MNEDQLIQELAGEILKGDYSADFDFRIPENIPASFFCVPDFNNGNPLKVSHKLKCYFYNHFDQVFLKHSIPYIVKERP